MPCDGRDSNLLALNAELEGQIVRRPLHSDGDSGLDRATYSGDDRLLSSFGRHLELIHAGQSVALENPCFGGWPIRKGIQDRVALGVTA